MDALRLEQRKRRTTQTFQIVDENLAISVESPIRTEKWKVPLDAINPEPVRFRRRAVIPIALAFPLVVFFFFWVAAMASSDSHLGGWGPLAYIFSFAAGTFAIRVMKKSKYFTSIDTLTFNSRTGHRLGLWFENPNKQEFDAFVKALQEAINEAQVRSPAVNSSMAAEIQKIKLLLEEGTISPEQFEAAKNKIVGLDKTGRIGF